ncbi:hypothetical protein B9G54_04815 [Alloscardovia macacae]|uniref:Cystathionine beta-lyase n=1 Tax=Alloscardovia macacae TaxID=1160091 RepID=A0A1Y2SZX5_9BIFI|nr:PLP-dependent transferase [Alloscardovia macacae]OTA26513.1 hypothetical protein B9G54_04815 [Alloscardovia macacae]OTA29808.1 hypothetical protein B9T39_01635 [Alloscardovia macacae]
MHKYFERWGLEFSESDMTRYDALRGAFESARQEGRPIRAMYVEVLTNPLLKVSSVELVARVAHEFGAFVIIDNTFVTPLNQQPIDLGAGIVVHSDIMAGVVVTNAPNLDEKLYFALNRGGALAPQDANLLRRGLQTLALRLEHQTGEHPDHRVLAGRQPFVTHVNDPALSTSPYHELASRTLRGVGSVLSFELEDTVDPDDALRATA